MNSYIKLFEIEFNGLSDIIKKSEFLELTYNDTYHKLIESYYSGHAFDTKNELRKKIESNKEFLNYLYSNYSNINYHWKLCSFSNYKTNLEPRKKEFIKRYPDSEDIDFYNEELIIYTDLVSDCISFIGESGYPENSDKLIISEFLTNENYKNVYFSTNKKIKHINETIEILQNQNTPKEIQISENDIFDKTQLKWFKVGIWFATGLIENLQKQDISFASISKLLGDKNYRPYISESWGNSNTTDKNIFSDKDKIKTITEFCEKNKIELSHCFTTKMNANR